MQFTIYTPLPGTRIFNDALRGNKLFTLDWDRYDVLTPVMKARVHPALVQMLQFAGNYSFYLRKFLIGKLRPHRVRDIKRTLVLNAHKFILAEMPTYLRDMLSLPLKLISISKLCSSLAKTRLDKQEVTELLQFTNEIIYLETGNKDRYFLIREPS